MTEGKKSDLLSGALYDVEHALNMYAYSYVHLPAAAIYEKDALNKFKGVLDNCHIYMIGYLPILNFEGARQEANKLITTMSMLDEKHDIEWELPPTLKLKEEDGYWFLAGEDGVRYFPTVEMMMQRLRATTDKLVFSVQYIGQAYGKEGDRSAVERLTKHETLQKISLKGVPKGYQLELLLLEIIPATRVITVFNPKAKDKDAGVARIRAGLDKLFGTDEKERVALYEASMIRYFKPRFNKEFVESFPSTNMKVLKDCYNKDFSALVAEVSFDELPYDISSDEVPAAHSHIARHYLHKDEDRKMFFSDK